MDSQMVITGLAYVGVFTLFSVALVGLWFIFFREANPPLERKRFSQMNNEERLRAMGLVG